MEAQTFRNGGFVQIAITTADRYRKTGIVRDRTKMDFVQRLLLNEEGGSEEGRGESVWQRLWEKVLLGVIFGVFCIISDYIGIQVTGALPNARVIGVLSAGFLGGPVSGFITTAIAAAHRYLIFPERISTVACVLSAVIHGIIGSFIGWKKKENRQYSNTFLLGVTFISEMIHIVLILLLTRPFDAAVEIVKIVIVPMVIINSVGMVIFFNVFKSIFNTEDLKVASKVSLAMRTAERCTPYLGSVENDRKTAGRIIDIIMEQLSETFICNKDLQDNEDQPRAFTGGRILSSL